jgi:hypothetical protein
VQKEALDQSIPLRYFQWDDWAPLDWTWPPRAFPSGASHWLGPDPYDSARPMPLSLYHGLWQGAPSAITSKFNWSADGHVSLDWRFFDDIFQNGTAAGMVSDLLHCCCLYGYSCRVGDQRQVGASSLATPT